MNEMLFFHGRSEEAVLYDALMQRLESALGPFDVIVQKTQITLRTNRVFGCVSPGPKGCIVVTFGLPSRIASERIHQASEPYPNRWTHHIRIYAEDELDEELIDWLKAAYAFASRK